MIVDLKFFQDPELPNESIQILYGENHDTEKKYYFWSAWYGPYGVAVDPCSEAPLEWVGAILAQNKGKGPSMDAPGFPPRGKWVEALPDLLEEKCEIFGYDDSPPRLLCGVSLTIEFQKDEKFDDQLIECKQGKFKALYHRGWTVEY
jgi:hypothetical protein